MRSDSKGLQLPGGPFIQVGHVNEDVNWSFSDRKDDGETVMGATLDYHTKPELFREAADMLAELAGAMRDMADRAEEQRSVLRELTF